jgi:hypothetical protein
VGPTCQTSRAAPGPRGSAPLPRGCHAPCSSRTLKALPGPRADVPTAPSRPSRPPPDRLAPDCLAPPARRLAPRAAVPIEPPSRPPRSEAASLGPSPCRPGHLTACPSPSCCTAVPAPLSRPFPRPSPVRRPCQVGHARGPRQHRKHGPRPA